jgi:hypothetical protein
VRGGPHVLRQQEQLRQVLLHGRRDRRRGAAQPLLGVDLGPLGEKILLQKLLYLMHVWIIDNVFLFREI